MMKSLASLLAVVLASLTASLASAQDASTPNGQRDLDVLVAFFTGNWDPRPDGPPVRLRVAEFWKGSAVRWLYLEWTPMVGEGKPLRQFVMRVREDGPRMSASLHRLPGDPARLAGEWGKKKPFEQLAPADLREIEHCRLDATRTMIAQFTLATAGRKCPGELPEMPFMRYDISLGSSQLLVIEQHLDREGKLVSERAPVELDRASRVPK